MKKTLALLLAAAMAFSALAAATPAKAEELDPAAFEELEAVELIGADNTSKGAAGQEFFEYLVDRVDEITGGQLTIDYHPNGELGSDQDLLGQSKDGDIDMVLCQTAQTVTFIPETAVFDLPMVFAKYDADAINEVLNGENDFHAAVQAAYEAANFHLLGFLQGATYRLTTSNKELADLDAFKGLQIRTMENNNHMKFWEAIGAEPTPLTWGEVYFSLQNGTIDAQENAADTCAGANLQEVQKYLSCTNHILYCNQLSINKDTYEGLDPLYQQALDQAVADSIAYMMPKLAEIDAENKAKLADGGMTITEYPDDFYDTVLALDGVKALYEDIDGQTNGLAALLTAALGE